MEIRKVQLTGGSSYVVTLPKEWVKSQKINKNDPVGLIAQPDGTLLLTSKTTGGREARVKEIEVDDIKDPVYLYRQLIGIYIMGYSTIVVSSEKRLAPGMRDSVIGFTQMAIGPEIMEEDMGAITIKDMLDPSCTYWCAPCTRTP
jgi:phosphate uptake regulator